MNKSKKIEKFLLNFQSKSTKSSYRSNLYKYFDTIKKNPDTYFDKPIDYDIIETDILTFRQYLNGKPPRSIRVRLSCIRVFLTEYKIDLPISFWNKLNRRIKGNSAVTRFTTPNNEDLKKILLFADIKYKALFLLLSSSGMRISEALQLKIGEDIYLEDCKVEIRGEYTKTGNPRITFFTPETRDAIADWLKVRDKHLQQRIARANNLGFTLSKDDKRLFLMNKSSAERSWIRLLKQAKYYEVDNITNRVKMSIHSLRKYFYSTLKLEIPEIIVEALVGHLSGLKGIYGKYTEEQIKQEYDKGKHKLYIFETEVADERIQELEDKIHQRDKEVDLLKEQIDLFTSHKVFTGQDEGWESDEILEMADMVEDDLKKVRNGENKPLPKQTKNKPTKKQDDIQEMKKQMKKMMKKIEELEET
jgi:integrase